MPEDQATLHLLAGKICAGKSSLAEELGRDPGTVLIGEDQWLASLFGDEMSTLGDYVRYSARLRTAMKPHLVALLRTGVSIVLDYPANTRSSRAWMRAIIDEAACRHALHFLDVPDEVCKARLRKRNAAGTHEFAATDEQFDKVSSHFEAPADSEGFNIVRHGGDAR
ncbi:MAG: ATP-binding protein [Alphaproteobacteria bacterium]|nr:ATP-binding protein [Alphaproteobacteria bacterium]